MELKFRIQEFKKVNAMPTFNPQVKRGFFNKWETIIFMPISDLASPFILSREAKCNYHTWGDAQKVIEQYKLLC